MIKNHELLACSKIYFHVIIPAIQALKVEKENYAVKKIMSFDFFM